MKVVLENLQAESLEEVVEELATALRATLFIDRFLAGALVFQVFAQVYSCRDLDDLCWRKRLMDAMEQTVATLEDKMAAEETNAKKEV